MEFKDHKEYQTIRLFATLGFMTLLLVLLFKVVLFAPQNAELSRQTVQSSVITLPEKKSEPGYFTK